MLADKDVPPPQMRASDAFLYTLLYKRGVAKRPLAVWMGRDPAESGGMHE